MHAKQWQSLWIIRIWKSYLKIVINLIKTKTKTKYNKIL